MKKKEQTITEEVVNIIDDKILDIAIEADYYSNIVTNVKKQYPEAKIKYTCNFGVKI